MPAAGGRIPRRKDKEIRINAVIAHHDLETKIRAIERLLNEGRQVCVNVFLNGRMRSHPEIAQNILHTISTELIDKAKMVGTPVLVGSPVSLRLGPK